MNTPCTAVSMPLLRLQNVQWLSPPVTKRKEMGVEAAADTAAADTAAADTATADTAAAAAEAEVAEVT